MPRRARGRREASASIAQSPPRLPRRTIQPAAAISEEQVETVHAASLRLLRDHGLECLSERACDLFERAGGRVNRETMRVRLDPEMVEETVAKAPESFTIHARNPARSMPVGDGHMAFAAVSSAPNASDLDHGRRQGVWEDFEKLVKLAQSLNAVHYLGGYPVEPTDIPPNTRHLDALRAYALLTDKPGRASALGRVRVEDAQALMAIVHGLTLDELERRTVLQTVVNINSPMRLDGPMADGLMAMAERNQCVIATPFTLLGAMAPVTIAGTLVQQNAEALFAVCLAQLTRAGAPVVYGSFVSNVDMKSGAPAFGTPEFVKAALAGGQMARRYGLPLRLSNVNASNAVDAQAAYESQMSLWAALLSGASLVQHAAGWLEGGLVASFEKMIIDADMIQMMIETLEPIAFDDVEEAMAAIEEVGPGGHFFGTPHTIARYATAFYAPMVSDWRNFESWTEAGSPDAATRANAVWKQLLADYEAPPTDAAIVEALDAFVARRKEELAGVSLD